MPREYSDERKAKALIDYATNLVPDKVKKLRKVDEIEKTFLNEVSRDFLFFFFLHVFVFWGRPDE